MEHSIALYYGGNTMNESTSCLSILASQLLSIPATSAPSEHVFSVAGLTISKDRARLASDVANELVFLHDALPGVQKY